MTHSGCSYIITICLILHMPHTDINSSILFPLLKTLEKQTWPITIQINRAYLHLIVILTAFVKTNQN